MIAASDASAGPALVQLDADHPGFHDPHYRRRRNEIARAALEHREGDAAPEIAYTDEEHSVWREVWRNLEPLHERYACSEYQEAAKRVALSRETIPQLDAVNHVIEPMHGFRMMPVAGLVTAGAFLRELARGVFLSTQYMRHHSVPLYTPEPDVVHELVGHAATSDASTGTRSNSECCAKRAGSRSTAPDCSPRSASSVVSRPRKGSMSGTSSGSRTRRTIRRAIRNVCSSRRASR